ncbi:hypothetical protein GQR58_001063 [Nymphon striatum]|nr:hypothetical protein GQR58_001063 [Nymphon striatum]
MSAICSGFVPHAVKATRCKRCFRELSDHRDDDKSSQKPAAAKPKPKPKGIKQKEIVNGSGKKSEKPGDGSRKEEDCDKQQSDEVSADPKVSVPLRRRRADNANDSGGSDSAIGSKRGSMRRSREVVPQDSDVVTRRRSGNDQDGNSDGPGKRVQIITTKEVERSSSPGQRVPPETSGEINSPDVEFILKVKTSRYNQKDLDETESIAGTETTETTETTLTFNDTMEDLQDSIHDLSNELQSSEKKVLKLEKEKQDILNRRMKSETDDEAMNKMASQLLKLRSEVNKLKTENEELNDKYKETFLEVEELEEELKKRQPPEVVQTTLNQLRTKLQQTEALCEELKEENKEIKQEIAELEEEIDEIQDNFKEDQVDEYRDLKRELEATSKNCRILQFKLKKSDNRCEELEIEKTNLCDQITEISSVDKIDVDKVKLKGLSEELKMAKEVGKQLANDLEEIKVTNKSLQKENSALKTGLTNGAQVKDVSRGIFQEQSPSGKPNSDQLVRDLYEAIERENDLKDQLKFSEQAAYMSRKKIGSLEQENESLVLQVRKMAQFRLGKHPKNVSVSDEPSIDDITLQLELNEQELIVLRKKLEESDCDNLSSLKELEFLRDKVASQPVTTFDLPEPSASEITDECKYHQQKIRILQNEAKDLRRKLIERERDNDRLKTEVSVLQKKGSKVMVRSRSLDEDLKVDLKRQLQLMEQEVSILRQKSTKLESENEKLNGENRRMSMRLGKKPPPSTAENLQMENMELNKQIEELQKKVNDLLSEVRPSTSEGVVEVVRRGSLTDSEQELITSLKKRIKCRDDELSELQTKFAKTEIENTKLGRELKKLKDRMISVPEERSQETDLYISLRGSETVQESLKETFDTEKKLQENAKRELTQKCQRLTEDVKKLNESKKSLESEFKTARESLKQSEVKLVELSKLSKSGESTGDNTFHVEKLTKENEELKENLNEFQEKLGDSAKNLSHNLEEMEKLKEENEQMVKKVKVIEDERKSLETQVKPKTTNLNKETVKKYKAQIKTLEESKEELENELLEVKDEVNMIFHLNESKSRLKNVDNRQTEVAMGWLNERTELKEKLAEFSKKYDESVKELEEMRKTIKDKELESEEQTDEDIEEKIKAIKEALKEEMEELRSANEKFKIKCAEQEENTGKSQKEIKELQENKKKIANQHRKEKDEWQNTEADFEAKIKSFQRKVEKQERDQKNEITIKDEELLMTKDKLVKVERDLRRLKAKQEEMERESQDKLAFEPRKLICYAQMRSHWCMGRHDRNSQITLSKTITILGLGNRFHCACASMTGLFSGNEPTAEVSKYEGNTKMWIFIKDLGKERQEYDDLTAKYDLLEEDYVVVKAKLVMDKENIEISYNKLKNEHETLSSELTTVRDTLNARQDAWIKDKLDKEERLKELEAKVSRAQGWEMERLQIQDTLNQNNSLIDSYKKEEKHLKHERDNLRRQVEDQARIINELQKMTTGTNAFSGDESERLTAVRNEKEQLVQLMGEEIQTMQKQILSFQKERDSYKEKLDLAEKLLEKNKFEAKKQDQSRKNATDSEKVSELQSEIEDLEDQLASGKLEVNNLRTGYLAEKSRWNIQMAEMKTKLNQLEERNLIDGLGRSSRMIAKTKLELAWDKERSEQQRLLAESKRLISELGDKLITVETLRDKERIDAKRQLESLKQTMKGEQGDTKKKIGELHSDLNELRHAHARVRGSTESLQKGKEYDSEKEEMRIRLVQLESHHENLSNLLTEVEKLSEIAPEVLEVAKQDNTYIKPNELTPYRGRPPLIKAASADSRTTQDEFQEMLFSILQKTKELKEVQANTEPFQKPYRRTLSASDRQQPLPGMSAIFHDDDPYKKWSTSNLRPNLPHPPPSMYITPPTQRSLYRKSVSLQDQSGIDSSTSKIWISTDTSEPGSMESLAASQASSKSAIGAGDYSTMPVRPERRSSERRRRTTEVSTESINEAAGRRSRRSVKDKIKNLVSSKSVEDSSTGKSIAGAAKISASVGLGSETPEEHKRDRSLTARIRNAFKKPSSRSTSVDKDADRDSADRKSPSPAARSHRGKLEPQSSIESVTSTKSVRNLILS